MAPAFWFWLIAFLALIAALSGIYGSMAPRDWGWRGWSGFGLLVWLELLILGWAQFGGPIK